MCKRGVVIFLDAVSVFIHKTEHSHTQPRTHKYFLMSANMVKVYDKYDKWQIQDPREDIDSKLFLGKIVKY